MTLEECVKLFRVNKEFGQFRYDQFVVNTLGMQCIYSMDSLKLKYLKKVLKHSGKPAHADYDYIN